MARYRWIRGVALVGLISLPFLLAGCGLFKSADSKQQIDPPPAEQGSSGLNDQTMNPTTQDTSAKSAKITLYFKDANGYVAPVTMNLPFVQSIAKEALQYMVQGGPEEGNLPAGFTALLPKGTMIKGINLDLNQQLAVVNFSKEFSHYDAKDERKILEAITWTLTGFPSINQVQLWVEGQPLKEMPVAQMPLDSPLTRSMGINLERTAGIDFSQSTPVTLYFENQTDDNFDYLVPVTRMIARTNDIASATLAQLIKGPSQGSKLQGVIAAQTQVLKVKDAEGLVTVNLGDQILGLDQKVPAKSLQSVVLSLTENTGDSKVQIMVNGSVKVDASDATNLSQPVSKPEHLNPYKL